VQAGGNAVASKTLFEPPHYKGRGAAAKAPEIAFELGHFGGSDANWNACAFNRSCLNEA
jgi:hypothetical protein